MPQFRGGGAIQRPPNQGEPGRCWSAPAGPGAHNALPLIGLGNDGALDTPEAGPHTREPGTRSTGTIPRPRSTRATDARPLRRTGDAERTKVVEYDPRTHAVIIDIGPGVFAVKRDRAVKVSGGLEKPFPARPWATAPYLKALDQASKPVYTALQRR